MAADLIIANDDARSNSSLCSLWKYIGKRCLQIGGLSVALSVCLDIHANASDWRTVRGNAHGTGVSSDQLSPNLEVLWEFKTSGDQEGFEGTPVIADGKVFVGDFKGTVYAIDLRTGTEVWRAKTKDGIMSAGAYMDGILVIGDFGGWLYAFEANTGKEIWSLELDAPVTSGPTFVEKDVLISTDSGSLAAYDIGTGQLKWSYATGDQLRSTACIWNSTALLGGCDSRLHRVDIQKGEASGESIPLNAPTLSTPNIVGSYAIVPTQPGVVYAIELKSNEVAWTYTPDPSMNTDIRASSATLAEEVEGKLKGITVVASRNRRLIALDTADGVLKWEKVLRKRSDSAPVLCSGIAWIGASDGMVYGIRLTDGKEVWSYQLKGAVLASPAIAGNRIVIATEKGSVVCFGDKK